MLGIGSHMVLWARIKSALGKTGIEAAIEAKRQTAWNKDYTKSSGERHKGDFSHIS